MRLPKTVRFDENLEIKISDYLEENDIKFSQLVNMAVAKFISEPHIIKLKPIADKDFLKSAKRAFKKHKDAMDKLK